MDAAWGVGRTRSLSFRPIHSLGRRAGLADSPTARRQTMTPSSSAAAIAVLSTGKRLGGSSFVFCRPFCAVRIFLNTMTAIRVQRSSALMLLRQMVAISVIRQSARQRQKRIGAAVTGCHAYGRLPPRIQPTTIRNYPVLILVRRHHPATASISALRPSVRPPNT